MASKDVDVLCRQNRFLTTYTLTLSRLQTAGSQASNGATMSFGACELQWLFSAGNGKDPSTNTTAASCANFLSQVKTQISGLSSTKEKKKERKSLC